MRLAGFAVGDGLCDPVTMLNYADFALQIGLIDQALATKLRVKQDNARTLISEGKFAEAENSFNEINSDIMTASGFSFHYNFLLSKAPASFAYYNEFVQTPKTRRAIHVGNLTYNDGMMVQEKLTDDFMRSVKPWIVELLNNNYKVRDTFVNPFHLYGYGYIPAGNLRFILHYANTGVHSIILFGHFCTAASTK